MNLMGLKKLLMVKEKLEEYIKEINKTKKFKSRINVDNLIKNKNDKGFNLIIEPFFKKKL